MADRLSITFGAFAPRLQQQLRGAGISRTEIAGFQASADAIVRLAVTGLLTGAETDKARLRLRSAIGAAARARKEKPPTGDTP